MRIYLEILAELCTPVYHALAIIASAFPREELLVRLKMPGSYYAKELPGKWQLIVLDTTEMSGHSGMPEVSFCDRYLCWYLYVEEFACRHSCALCSAFYLRCAGNGKPWG